jgi:glyoxylase-like metal-dependent hydrolase (beta-lactamase superfamily II)
MGHAARPFSLDVSGAVVHGSWDEVAEGVWHGRYAPFDVTVAVVAGAEASLVVDTRAGPAQAGELQADVAALAVPPVTHVVNTHAHGDHCFGNAAFAGHTRLWGHRGCAAALAGERGESQRRHLRDALAAETGAADSVDADNGPGTAADDIARADIAAPDHLVDDLAELDVGGRRVALRWLGRGHTDHDLVVDVPDAKTVVAGDLVEHSGPPTFADSDPLAWPETVDRLRALGRRVIVPGHGAAVGPLFVADQQADLAAVAELVRQVDRGTLRVEQAVGKSPLPEDAIRAALARGQRP